MADFARYSTGPSAEWLRFDKTWKWPEAIPTITIREARDQANRKTAKLFANILGRPDTGLEVTDFDIPTTNGVKIPIRLYRPLKEDSGSCPESPALYISFHGGGYHFGSLETEDPHCRQTALNTAGQGSNGLRRNDLSTASTRKRYSSGGVSAGANLAISVALRALRDDSLPSVKGLVLGTPSAVHPDHFPVELLKGGQSFLELHKDAPFINAQKLRNPIDLYRPDPTDPSFSPLL
ncbi:Abhydrolase-3 domain-containing protein [Fusarium falciforme]|uniref:Abhydrolase-3 domain-containing protein n=1 Tax=Fusarium falciforme TaxID=195108 RepID=UPI002301DB6A|nr:Abhydrolase-3 domain-containing protein [Fusarium falciforme]WAO95593.1 Abhydrolase-3 domain-containing protein [Fusarium falciforme]